MLYIERVKHLPLELLYHTATYKSYSVLRPTSLSTASTTHTQALKRGSITDTYTANNILSSYTKCQNFESAHRLFDEMPQRDTVTWNTMITGYTNHGVYVKALEVMKAMRNNGFSHDQYTFGSVLKGVACMGRVDIGKHIHSVVVKTGYESNVYSGSALLDMYSKCNKMGEACAVFQGMTEKNLVSWNAMIAGYVQLGDRGTAFRLLGCVEREGITPDDGTFAGLLTLLDDPRYYRLTTQIHAKIIKFNLVLHATACNACITAYSECGSIEDSERVFEEAADIRDLVTWNSMLAAYVVCDHGTLSFKLFIEMQRLGIVGDLYTYTSVISSCTQTDQQNQGKTLHGLAIKRGLEQATPVCNSLIAMYLKVNNNCMIDTIKLFNSLEFKDSVSWNTILTGFSLNSLSEDALNFFVWMRTMSIAIDKYTFSVVLRSCADLATFQLGQQVHALVVKSGVESNDFVASALIFMYSKCGIIEDARKSFEETQKDNTVTWNSIIFGYAQDGQGKTALGLFSEMQSTEVKPDHITFVAVLTACSHIGLVKEGFDFLKSMETDYGIPPRMEHYACAVDLFGRAGRLTEAKELIQSMPFEPDAMVLKTLLGACKMKDDIELASEVARILLVLEPAEHCTYVLLSDMYGRLGRRDEKANVKKMMRERGVKKVPGWSWVEVKNEVHAFKAEDRLHPQSEEIYRTLGELMEEISWFKDYAYVDLHDLGFDYEGGGCD